MRSVLALGCVVAYLAYGLVAGAGHLHEAANHHEESRRLHLDHSHLGDASHHHHHHHPSPPADCEARHDGHHHGDVLYPVATAQRSLESGPRIFPAAIASAATFDAPDPVSTKRNDVADPLRGPPQQRPSPSRAPPA